MAPAASRSDSTLIELFLDMLASERGAAPNSLTAYRRDLDDLSAHLGETGEMLGSATTEDIRHYLACLAQRGFKTSSVARRLSAARQIYRFLYAEGYRGDDPASVLEGPKRGRPLPKILSIDEVDRMLAHARAGMTDAQRSRSERLRAARLTCLLEVLYATGLRVSELVALPRSAAQRGSRARRARFDAHLAARYHRRVRREN